jgi:hypothetical protein
MATSIGHICARPACFMIRVTEELKKQIHAAMEAANGKTADAARLLGMPLRNLMNFVHGNKDLKARWATSTTEVKPPNELAVLGRPAFPVEETNEGIMASDDEVAAAVEREDSQVRRGLDAMGVKGGTLEMAMALQKFQRAHFSRAIEMLGGGMTRQSLALMVEIDTITDTLNDPTGGLAPARELMLREDRARLLETLGKFFDRANAAVLIQAKVKAIQHKKEKPNKPKGFLAIQAQSGSSVNVNVPE